MLSSNQGLYMMIGKDGHLAVLERELAQDRNKYMIYKGSGKDCFTAMHYSDKGSINYLYTDYVKVVCFRINPGSVTIVLT